MNTHSKSAQNSDQTPATALTEQTQAELLSDLEREVAALGDREDLKDYEILIKELLTNIHDCDELTATYKKLQAASVHPVGNYQTKNPITDAPQPFKIAPPRRVSIDELIKRRNQEMGLDPLPLESDLLLQRIGQGGHSGQFLADAFISAYRTNQPFTHSLAHL